MKIFNSIAVGSLLCTVLIIGACTKKSTSGGSVTPPPPPPPANTLAVTLSKAQIFADGWEETSFTVKDQSGTDVTSSSTIYIDAGSYSRSTFWTSTAGTYRVKATKSGVTSPEITLTAVDPGPSPFSQKIVVEDYTGTWCGHCPRVGVALENYVNAGHPNCIVIANHGPSSDPYTFSSHAALANSFSVTGYPSAWVDRDIKWNENTAQLNEQFTNRRAPLGLALVTSISGNTVNVTTKVKFDVSTSANLKLITYLVEDDLVYPQVNYGYFGLPNPISGYVHNAVLRATGLDLFGENIPTDKQVKGVTYEKTFSINTSGYNLNKCRIIAFVVQGPNNQGRKEKIVHNAQVVSAGQSRNFD
ncbi:MAG: Omp28-related outer membrane protein [Chitinophagaceae bacterium]|nr:MAG: Omp28-related outer membrane protein [Chitinophagaceae bacterium]